MYQANGLRKLPHDHKDSLYKIGTIVTVSRECIHKDVRNPELPEWFKAVIVWAPPEPGNSYRWYDPFVWFRSDYILSNGSEWSTEDRHVCYVGKLWYPCPHIEGTGAWKDHCNPRCGSKNFWIKPI